jgi:hypothetical protein
MKYKLEKVDFDKETGISYVLIKTPIGNFDGYCKLHEEDRDIISNFFGCKIAETRARVKYLKALIQKQKIKVETLENLVNNIEKINGYEKDCAEARFVRKNYFIELEKYNRMKETVTDVNDLVHHLILEYREQLFELEKQVAGIRKKREENNKKEED